MTFMNISWNVARLLLPRWKVGNHEWNDAQKTLLTMTNDTKVICQLFCRILAISLVSPAASALSATTRRCSIDYAANARRCESFGTKLLRKVFTALTLPLLFGHLRSFQLTAEDRGSQLRPGGGRRIPGDRHGSGSWR